MKHITINNKVLDYTTWRNLYGGWGAVSRRDTNMYSNKRQKLPPDLEERRRQHMKQAHAQGAPYSWIAYMYGMDRAQVYRIVNDIPNH